MDLFGHHAYAVFFITLEIYGDEYNHLDSEEWLTISQRFLARKLRLSSTKVQQILNFYSERQRILVKMTETTISIKCPKFVDIASNWTKRKTFKSSAHLCSPSVVPTAIEEKKKRRRREENIPSLKFCVFLDSVKLTQDQYEKLQLTLGQKVLDSGIEKLDYSITVKGGKYKDHYKTLLNWHKRGFLTEDKNGKSGGYFTKRSTGSLPADIEESTDATARKWREAQKTADSISEKES